MTEDLRKAVEESRKEHEEAAKAERKKEYLDAIETKFHLCAASAEGLADFGRISAEIGYDEEIDLDEEIFKDWSEATIERLKKNKNINHVLDFEALEHIKGDPRMVVGNMATALMEFLSDMITPRLMLELAARTAGAEVFKEMCDDIRGTGGPNVEVRRINLREGSSLQDIIQEIIKDIHRHRREEDLDEEDE